jgi:hypothetical protein
LSSAHQQGNADLLLQIGNLFTDGRLRHVQRPCAAAETLMRGDSAEITQMTQIHISSLSVSPIDIV